MEAVSGRWELGVPSLRRPQTLHEVLQRHGFGVLGSAQGVIFNDFKLRRLFCDHLFSRVRGDLLLLLR